MVPDIINLQLDTYTLWALLGGGGRALRELHGLEQELPERLQPTPTGAGCSPVPSCYGAGESRAAGYTLSWLGTHYGGWTHIISALPAASMHKQDLSRGSFLLVPLKCLYRNQNSQRAAKLFPFGCAPDQTSSKNLSRALSKHQRAPSSRPAPSPGPASLLKGPGGHRRSAASGESGSGCQPVSQQLWYTHKRGCRGRGGVSESLFRAERCFTGVRAEIFIGWQRAGLAQLQPKAPASTLLSLRKHGFTGVL